MGKSASKNIVDDATSIFTNVINNSVLDCTQVIEGNQVVTITAKNGSTVNYEGGPVQYIDFDGTCFQQASSNNNVSTQVTNEIQQIAESIIGSLGIGETKAKNTTDIVSDLGTSIINTYETECSSVLTGAQSVNIKATDGSTINAIINQEQVIDSLTQCISQDSAVTQSQTDLQNNIEQEATAKIEGLLGPLLFITLIIAIVVGFVIYAGFSGLMKPQTLLILALIIGVIVAIYIGVAIWQKWFPFRK